MVPEAFLEWLEPMNYLTSGMDSQDEQGMDDGVNNDVADTD